MFICDHFPYSPTRSNAPMIVSLPHNYWTRQNVNKEDNSILYLASKTNRLILPNKIYKR